MIDLKHEARNFAPMNMPEAAAESFDEDIRWAYSLYNKALQYIRKGYDDMARQNLKKAIGLYPDFYPARMLLGVCLFANGDRVGAMRMFNAIKDMQYKRLALSYYDYLTEEVDKTVAQSGTRLILKDLYRATAASNAKLSDITKPLKADIRKDAADGRKPESGHSFRSQPLPEARQEVEPVNELDSLTVGDLSFETPVQEKEKAEHTDGAEEISREKSGPEPDAALLPDEDTDDFEIPKFITEKRQTLITSRKNDGVVEEIVKQQLEAAQKAARYSGHGKKPFSYNQVYKKKVFSEEDGAAEEKETAGKQEDGESYVPAPKDNIILSVASVIILIFMIVISVSLMGQITENRKLRNELDDLKKLYAQSQITPGPSPDSHYYSDSPVGNPEYTPFSTSDPTPVATEAPTPTIAPAATPAATQAVN